MKYVLLLVTLSNLFVLTGYAQTPTPSQLIEYNQASAQFGWSVASQGDVNADGYEDVIIGAQYYDNGQTDEGAVFVYHGTPNGLDTLPAVILECNQAIAYFGRSVAFAGDINGDGYDDIIAGAYSFDNEEGNEGRVYIYHGSASGITATPAATIESNQINANFGVSVDGAGDVNGDGYDDIIVGAWLFDFGQADEGRAFVFLGSSTGIIITPNATVETNQNFAHFAGSVSGAGDINADGYDDVIVGCPDCDFGETNEGKIYIYHGSATGINTTAAATIESNQTLASYGFAISDAGDVNADGYADIVVGSYLYDNDIPDEGRVFVYHGSALGINTTPAVTMESNKNSSNYGVALNNAGDINADGYDDIIVGAATLTNGQTAEGRAYYYYGSATGVNPTPVGVMESDQATAYLGNAVAGGDVNGDSFSDLITSSYYFDNGESNEGVVFIYFTCTDTFYADIDGDGYGDPLYPVNECTSPVNFVSDTTDCDILNAAINPSATEICNAIDDNCNGLIDEELIASVSITAAGATTFCEGVNVVLTATYFGESIQWQKNGVNIPGATNMNYTAKKTGNYTCVATDECGPVISNTISVTVNKNPSATITADGETTFCAGDSVVLNVTPVGGSVYQWYKGASPIVGATLTSYVATVSGNYKCRVTKVASGCYKNSNNIPVNVTCKEGELHEKNIFSISPNPANDLITIELGNLSTHEIYLYDAIGQLVQTISTNEAIVVIEINNLPSGIYFINIKNNFGYSMQQFVKE